MNSRMFRSFALCVGFFCLTGFVSCNGTSSLPKATLEIETRSGAVVPAGTVVPVVVEIARTAKEQEKGFMERKSIPDGTGMIFVYTSDRVMRFWMKNTPSALSIAYIDSSGMIREIYDMTPFSLETVSSERSLRHALEVPQGWFNRAGIAVGDSLTPASLAALAK